MASTTVAGELTIDAFKTLIGEIHDINGTQGILGWDLEVMMPEKGAAVRAKQMATLAKISHEMMTGPQMDRFIEAFRAPEAVAKLSPADQALVREVTRSYDKTRRIPVDLLQKMVETTAEAHQIWVEARKEKNFAKFAPILARIIDLNRQMAEKLGYENSPYDALLDEYEPGLTTAQLDPLFARLKSEIVPLLQAIRNSSVKADTGVMQGMFPAEKQMEFSRRVLQDMGFDFAAGRLDLSAHPFSSGSSTGDVRLTTRVDETDVFSALSSSMHEGGHGMYEQGINPAFNRTPLGEGTSLGIHESQSRMWENQVGRSKAFWSHYFPKLQARYPGEMKSADLETFYRAVNKVRPSFIRVESDEVTYNLHILVRYEIEKALIEGAMAVDEIPAAWAEKMQSYLGVTPANDAEGCLQDIHWSHGSFGYFPTYTLGNLYAAQFFATAKKQMPDLENNIAQGNLLPLKEWLNRQVHFVGKSETAETIVNRVCGEPLDARYFVDYLWEKYGEVFDIKRP